MKIEVEESALDAIAAMGKRLQEERDELLAFAVEYVEAWRDGMAGDSFMLRNAEKLIAKCTAEPDILEGKQ